MPDKEHLLLLLKENPSLTQVEFAEMMDKLRRTIQKIIKHLVEKGLIERAGSKKTGLWIVKNVGKLEIGMEIILDDKDFILLPWQSSE